MKKLILAMILSLPLLAQEVPLNADPSTTKLVVFPGDRAILTVEQSPAVYLYGSAFVLVAPRIVTVEPGGRVYMGAHQFGEPPESLRVNDRFMFNVALPAPLYFTYIAPSGERIVANGLAFPAPVGGPVTYRIVRAFAF